MEIRIAKNLGSIMLLIISMLCCVSTPGMTYAEQADWREMLEQIRAEEEQYAELSSGIYCPESAMQPLRPESEGKAYYQNKMVFDDEYHVVADAAEEFNVVADAEDAVAVANMVIRNCIMEPSGLPLIFYLRTVDYDAGLNVWIVRYAVWIEGERPTIHALGGHTAFAIDAKTGAYLTRWGEE